MRFILISYLSLLIHSSTLILSIYSHFVVVFFLFSLIYLFSLIVFLCLRLLNLLIIYSFHSHYLLAYFIFYFLISKLLDNSIFSFFYLTRRADEHAKSRHHFTIKSVVKLP